MGLSTTSKWVNLLSSTPLAASFNTTAGAGTPINIDDSAGFAYYLSGNLVKSLNIQGVYNPRNFGAKGDGTTDDYAAFTAMLAAMSDRGGSIYIPRGYYRLSQKLVFTKQVRIFGEGWSQNPGIVGAVNYPGVTTYTGSILIFDADVGGLQFIAYTDNNANATAFEFQSSVFSSIENIMLYSSGGTGVSAHGIETRTVLYARNIRIDSFAGDGLHIEGWSTGAVPYGSSDSSCFISVKCRGNAIHGIHVKGDDVNAMSFLGCDTALNGGCGVLDEGFLGNSYIGHHAATNNQSFGVASAQRTKVIADAPLLAASDTGSYYTTSTSGAHIFHGCYAEGGAGLKAHLIAPTVASGGNLVGAAGAGLTSTSTAAIYGLGLILNVDNLTPLAAALTINKNLTVSQAGSIATLALTPGTATFSNIQMQSTGNSIATGLDILAGGNNAFFSCDNFIFRTAAATNLLTIDSAGNGIFTASLKATLYKVGANQVVGARGAAVADAVNAVGAPTQAEFNAFVTQFNLWLARARAATGHGLIA